MQISGGTIHYGNLAARDTAVIGTFLFAGLRRTELIKLHLRDVNLADDILTVRHGKGGRMRALPMNQRLSALIGEWLMQRPDCEHACLFVNREGQPLGRQAVNLTLARAKRLVGIDRDGVIVHTLRHSFACALLRGGANLVDIKQLRGTQVWRRPRSTCTSRGWSSETRWLLTACAGHRRACDPEITGLQNAGLTAGCAHQRVPWYSNASLRLETATSILC